MSATTPYASAIVPSERSQLPRMLAGTVRRQTEAGCESRTGAAHALQHAQDEQGREGVLQSQAKVGSEVHDESEHVDGAASYVVRCVPQNGGQDAGHDHVGGYAEVDGLHRRPQAACQSVGGRVVDEAAEWGEHAGEGDDENYTAPLRL